MINAKEQNTDQLLNYLEVDFYYFWIVWRHGVKMQIDGYRMTDMLISLSLLQCHMCQFEFWKDIPT